MKAELLRRQAGRSLHRFGIASALGCSIAIVVAGVARAEPLLPLSSFLETVDVSEKPLPDSFACSGAAGGSTCGGNGTGLISIGAPSGFGAPGLATVNLVNPGAGPLTISSSASSKGAVSSSASGEADYYLKLLGPAPTSPNQTIAVRVDIKAHADVSLSNLSDSVARVTATAGIDIFNPLSQTIQPVKSVFGPNNFVPSEFGAAAGNFVCPGGGCVSVVDFDGSLLYLLQPNVQYQVSVFANAGTTDSFLGPAGTSFETANALVDPHFFLDPVFGDPNYQLLRSPYISNDSPGLGAVPEPSTWAMILIGFAGLVLASYKQTKRRALAA